MKIELAKTEVIHFIGIGGIGMSGLSLIMTLKCPSVSYRVFEYRPDKSLGFLCVFRMKFTGILDHI